MPQSQPNLLILIVDQLTGTLFPEGPAAFLHAPNLRALAERSVRFCNAYAPSPLCWPSRASLMSGQLPSKTGVYDNAALFPADIPTFAHYLRRAGYQTSLSGKMHFVGPDQLHGYEERLTTDIYPADFGWTPDYDNSGERIDWWYHNMGSVTGAGVAEITNQLEFDDEVTYHAARKLHDLSRRLDPRPWSLTVSLTHPHDPYVARPRYFDLYAESEALDPVVAPIPFERQDPHSQRLMVACDQLATNPTRKQVRRARRAYFANISYVDDKIGELLAILERGGMAETTAVIFLSDHGEMLGERPQIRGVEKRRRPIREQRARELIDDEDQQVGLRLRHRGALLSRQSAIILLIPSIRCIMTQDNGKRRPKQTATGTGKLFVY